MAGEFLHVPGNIKQIFLPFVLDPNNGMNNDPINVISCAQSEVDSGVENPLTDHTQTQFFTFRPNAIVGSPVAGCYNVVPASFSDPARGLMDNDMSFKLIYQKNEVDAHKADSRNQKNIANTMLDYIPTVTVREFQQDAKLDILMNIFSSLGSGWSAGATAAEKANAKDKGVTWMERVQSLVNGLGKAMDAGSVMVRNMQQIMKDIFAGPNGVTAISNFGTDDYVQFILGIPHVLYYKMMSSTSMNIYELPYNGGVLYQSDGGGFNQRHLINGVDGTSEGVIGTLRNFIGKNIRVNTTPTWDGAEGGEGTQVQMEVILFNDTLESALRNFLLVNTIVPNNMWMQYHIFQHAPALYDVRIDGIKRLYMCRGAFSCEPIGSQLRIPPKLFFSELEKHKNKIWKKTKGPSLDELGIRIPDMYKLTCTFTSLLPDNLNNYLFSYYGNNKITKLAGNGIRQESVVNKVMSNMAKEFGVIWRAPTFADDVLSRECTLADYWDEDGETLLDREELLTMDNPDKYYRIERRLGVKN